MRTVFQRRLWNGSRTMRVEYPGAETRTSWGARRTPNAATPRVDTGSTKRPIRTTASRTIRFVSPSTTETYTFLCVGVSSVRGGGGDGGGDGAVSRSSPPLHPAATASTAAPIAAARFTLRPARSRSAPARPRRAAPRGERKREAAAEARVHVGDVMAAVVLAEALDVRRTPDRERLRDVSPERDQVPVLHRHALDGFAALGLDHCSRDRIQAAPLEVAQHVDRELLALAARLDERRHRRPLEVERELRTVVRTVDVPRAEALPRLDEYGKRGLGRELVGQPAGRRGDPTLLEEAVREVLVARAPHDLQRGQQHGRPERFTLGGQQLVVEVGKWHDEPHAVGVDELTKRAQIGGIVDARNEREVVGVVE